MGKAAPEEEIGQRTGCADEAVVVLQREDRVREIAEELLEQTRDTVDVVVEAFWVSKVQSWVLRVCFKMVSLVLTGLRRVW